MTRTMQVLTVLATTVLGASAAGAAGKMHVVRFTGVGRAYNYFLAPFSRSVAEEGTPGGLVARGGDLVVFGEWPGRDSGGPDLAFRYRAEDGETLELRKEGGRLLLSGKAVVVDLAREDGRAWVAAASEEDLRALRLVQTALGEAEQPALKRVLVARPTVDLMLNGNAPGGPAATWALLAGARPGLLFCEEADLLESEHRDRDVLAALRVLITGLKPVEEEGHPTRPRPAPWLADLKALERLIVVGGLPQTDHLPTGLKAFGALLANETPLQTDALDRLAGAEELVLLGMPVPNFEATAKIEKLQVLSLAGCEGVADLTPVAKLPLGWLSVPPAITQEAFAKAVAAHPDLVAVELQGAEGVTDVAPLAGIEKLRALFVIPSEDAAALPSGLEQLKGLDLLVLSQKVSAKEPERVAALKEKLPDTLIVAGKGLCLGSGWVLLLVPAATGAWVWSRRRRRAAR